ncbi:neural cell adhesion molecule 1-like [Oculina patagonica]
MSFINSLCNCLYCCVLLALLFLPHAACQISFTSKYAGKTVTGLVGSSVNFTWSFTGDVERVDWGLKKDRVNDFDNGGILVTIKNGLVSVSGPSIYNRRVSGIGDVSSGQVIFTLSPIRKSDERYYGCSIDKTTDFDPPKFDSVYLTVEEAPQISRSSAQASYNEGSSVNFSCIASGTPEPDVKWIRNGVVKSSGKKKAFLTFSGISRADDGQYTCKANNSAGRDENHVTLVIHYPPTIKEATTSAVKSWIGRRVTLKCVSDGVPTPTLTWYKPDGNQIKKVTATQNSVNVKMNADQDFGGYKCDADNGLTPADLKIVKIEQIKRPGAPTVVIGQSDIQATSLTVKWTAPADDGGCPITAYRVVILKGGTEIKNENVTDPGTTSLSVGGLYRHTNYTVKVFARNAVFEGHAGEKAVKTKYEGVPAAAAIEDLPSEVTDDMITLKWSEPQNNGREITQYTVYQRIVTDGKPGEWTKLKTIKDISVRELKVELDKGKVYEFVVTATNELGESLKEDGKIKSVKASGVPAAVEMDDIPSEVTDSIITLKWKEPQSYGREIIEYTVYRRIVTDGKPGAWFKLKTITDTSVRELKVELEKGKEYEFVVTATNMHGESKIEESKIKRVKVKGGMFLINACNFKGGSGIQSGDAGEDNGKGAALYAGVAATVVVLIVGITVIIILWRRRKPSSHDETSTGEL